ncbi:olfactory receptor 5V1-like [Hemicordylus capensis]|uniref:olfactory receptor 5V1-like n=1 Tax=Hemicordylus capensis TaxID=884348 RepID=UPI0023035133|nr:olfactory receptor 5V1-like [Hemicordylus capensis]
MNVNGTTMIEFVLLGLSHRSDLRILLFIVFLIIYLFILMGNILVFIAIVSNRTLHTPMYFFLRHLSFLDICYTTVTLPQMLVNLMAERKTISFLGCAMQMFFYIFLGAAVCYLLAIMAYDRYLAICHPLNYVRFMTRRVCLLLISGCWIIGLSISLVQTVLIFSYPFCGSDIINHFFCDIPPVLRLHCPSPYINNVNQFLTIFLVLITPFACILVSYILIMGAIMKIAMLDGRQKAMGTCSSHLLSVVLFYGTAMFTYLRPSSSESITIHKLLSLTYTMVPAMLNPIIYSLRNKQVKDALKNTFAKIKTLVDI